MLGPLTDRQNASIEDAQPNTTLEVNTNNNNQVDEQAVEKFSLPQAPAEYGSRTIALNYLLDFAIQFTYHELSILTELLQKKSESDRKISLAHFARSTRLIFLKLYAIVKWVKKSKKFDQLDNICFFLDQQCEYFVETADRFAHVSRAELIFAGLPLYQIAKATDVLTNGTYPHLPQAIKKRHIQEKFLTKRQNKLALQWLDNSIQYRLIQEAANLPSGITKIEIKNGMAIFTVSDEFVLKMTILPVETLVQGEDENVANVESWRWTVLDFEILVVDYEIGCGSNLMHLTQKPPLIALCQAQITQSQNDIENVYKVLHEFCIKLRLDILFCQVDYLSTTVSRSYVYTERYEPKKGILNIKYWTKNRKSTNYSIRIVKNQLHLCAGLKLHHYPQNTNLPTLSNVTSPNFHQIFSQTIFLRCQELLERVKQNFSSTIPQNSSIRLFQHNQQLIYRLLNFDDLSQEENLQICVNSFTGEIKCQIMIFKANEQDNLLDLEKQLNSELHLNPTHFIKCLQKIQIQLLMKRYKEALDLSCVRLLDKQQFPIQEKLKELLIEEFLCLQLIYEPKMYLIVEFDHKIETDAQVQFILFDFNDELFKTTKLDQYQLLELTNLNEYSIRNRSHLFNLLSTLIEKILFNRIADQLMECRVSVEKQHHNNAIDEFGLKFNNFKSILTKNTDKSFDNIIDCFIHQSNFTHQSNFIYLINSYYQGSEPLLSWSFECSLKERNLPRVYSDLCVFKNRVQTYTEELQLIRHKNLSISTQISSQVLERLKSYSLLHNAFKDFAIAYEYYYKQECNIVNCAYNRLSIAYGETRSNIMSIVYKPKTQNFILNFINAANSDPNNLNVKTSSTILWNPHQLFYQSLTEWFNRDYDLTSIVQYLINTYSSVLSLYYFAIPRLRSLKAYSQMMGVDEKNFAVELRPFVKVMSPTRIRIVYGIIYLDFNLLSGNRVLLDSCIVMDKKRHRFESVPMFYEFWHSYSRGTVVVTQKAKTTTNSMGASTHIKNESNYSDSMSPLTPNSGNTSTLTPNSGHNKVSPPPQRPISAPAAAQLGTPPKQEHNTSSSLQSLLLDSNALQSAMLNKNSPNYTSSFDEYLHAINFFFSVGSALSHMAKNKKAHFPLTDVRYGLDFIELSGVGVANAALNVDPWNVRLYLYLCNQSFAIRCNLTFTGVYVPDLKYVQVFERYFESRIVPQYNEMEILSFVNICRVMADGVFGHIAQIMDLELTTKENSLNSNLPKPIWRVNMLFSLLTPPQPQEKINLQAPSRRFIAGLMISNDCKHLLITLGIRSNPLKKGQRSVAKRVELVYVLPSNTVTIRKVYTGQRASETDQKTVEALLSEVNKNESITECRIWSAVQQVLSKFKP